MAYPTVYYPTNQKPWITGYYGWRKNPVTGKWSLHRGYDLALREGTYLRPVIDSPGTCYNFYEPGGAGKWIYIRHDNGKGEVMFHLKNYMVKNGSRIKGNTIVGTMGKTGGVTGVHTHVEVHNKTGSKPIWSSATPVYFKRRTVEQTASPIIVIKPANELADLKSKVQALQGTNKQLKNAIKQIFNITSKLK